MLDRTRSRIRRQPGLCTGVDVLDARQHVVRPVRHAQADGIDMRDLVEPALGHGSMSLPRNLPESFGRPREPAGLAPGARRPAGEKQAICNLALDSDTEAVDLLKAARVLAELQPDGLEVDAAFSWRKRASRSFDESAMLLKAAGETSDAPLRGGGRSCQVVALTHCWRQDGLPLLRGTRAPVNSGASKRSSNHAYQPVVVT